MAATTTNDNSHLSALDGFRGSLAIWVLLGHLSVAVGISIPIVSAPALAVDLFMVLSGFLMVHTWEPRLTSENIFSRPILAFYLSRFFRIAPLFYLLLVVCYLFLPELKQMTDFNNSSIPPPWISDTRNYHPKANWDFDSAKWLFLHTTFLFGLSPEMESSSPLPEWSLSLEMQFYLLFPVLLFLFRKVHFLVISVVVAMFSAAAPKLFGIYLEPGLITHFGQPSHLFYRLNAFVAGMALAILLQNRKTVTAITSSDIYLTIGAVICILPLNPLVILAYFFFALIVLFKIPFFTWFLSTKPMRFLGDVSYSVYLGHMLVVTPVMYWLIKNTNFLNFSPLLRFCLGAVVIFPLVFLLSYALFTLVESPTAKHGRKVSRNVLNSDNSKLSMKMAPQHSTD